ncbi:hypothetical protein Hypma_009713 [Hypsizygus marmoreus]|uniref:Uncharacterized protein n=1 Tax=Hypsizygus marmoreus TaxID=39966 RepID=A0A369JMD3_HYPMA|nr:hypothetical protein Hypma_009713 [Hypsizygus marmoreus]
MAYFPPPEAYQITVASYIAVGSLAGLLWDMLAHLDQEYEIVVRSEISVPTVTYFLARLTIFSSLFIAILSTAPLGKSCHRLGEAVCVFYHLTYSTTALLFFLRLRAVYHGNKPIIVLGFLLWLGAIGSALTSLIGSGGSAIEMQPSHYCALSPVTVFVNALPVTSAAFDTFVFLAISWRLLQSHNIESQRSKAGLLKHVLLGRDIPAVSRALLQDGHVYYMVSLIANFAVVLIAFHPAIPNIFRYTIISNTTLMNIMRSAFDSYGDQGLARGLKDE